VHVRRRRPDVDARPDRANRAVCVADHRPDEHHFRSDEYDGDHGDHGDVRVDHDVSAARDQPVRPRRHVR
jgi:hypothetical protein